MQKLFNVERNSDQPDLLQGVTNVYEQLVIDHLRKVGGDLSMEAQADAAGNRLSPTRFGAARYIDAILNTQYARPTLMGEGDTYAFWFYGRLPQPG